MVKLLICSDLPSSVSITECVHYIFALFCFFSFFFVSFHLSACRPTVYTYTVLLTVPVPLWYIQLNQLTGFFFYFFK